MQYWYRRETDLGNRDASAGGLADLADLAAGATDDAANHVCGNADVLRLELLAVLIVGRRAARGSIRVGAAVEGTTATVAAEVGTVAGPQDAGTAELLAPAGRSVSCVGGRADGGGSRAGAGDGVVEDGAGATLPVVDEALGDLPDGGSNAFGGALDLDNPLGGLGEHLLLGDHANARGVLDVLDLEALAADDGTHLVVGDEKLDGYRKDVSAGPIHPRVETAVDVR